VVCMGGSAKQDHHESQDSKVMDDGNCDIELTDIDALPWIGGGMMLLVREMHQLYLNLDNSN